MLQPPADDDEMAMTFDFPEFEPFEPDDRPPAPDEDDFPIDCTVDLVDADAARLAQTAALWEPFMENLFRGRTLAVVKRHRGDYTFLMCQDQDNPSVMIGCTLYRACLKEPKVKMKKYIPTEDENGNLDAPPGNGTPRIAPMPSIVETSEDALFPVLDDADRDDEDILLQPVSPTTIQDTAEPSPRPQAPEAPSGSTQSDFRHRVPVPPSTSHVGGSHSSITVPAQQHLFPPAVVNAAKSRRLMSSGNSAFAKKDLEKAVKLYTEAYELDRADGARILSNRSAALLALRRPEAALADARVVMRLTPKSTVGYIRAGNVFHQLKRFDESKLCYEKALAIDSHKSADLQFSLRNNAVLAVYYSKTERQPVSVQVNRQLQIVGVSKRSVRPGETVWTETTSCVVPADVNTNPQHFCGHCFRSLLKAPELAQQIPGVEVSIIASLMREASAVGCHEGCSQRYCSESCRLKAWTEHHWIECDVKGKWAAAMGQIRAIFSSERTQRHEQHMIAAARLALRMMVKVLSSGRPLSEAVHNFGWLHEGAPLSPAVCAVVSSVLQPAYLAIHPCLTREERALLDLSFAVSLFRRSLCNMVATVASPWPMIVSNVETNLALIRQRGTSHPGLESILALRPYEMVGVSIRCMAVFEIFSVTLLADDGGAGPNITMRKEGETANLGVFIASRPIARSGSLVGSR